MTLQDQIRQRWGNTGDWNQGGIDRVAEFASLLRANGIEDLSKVGLTRSQYTVPGSVSGAESGDTVIPERQVDGRQLTYDGRSIGFLGDVNRDGSLARVGEQSHLGMYGLDDDRLGWSATGKGSVTYKMVTGPDGQVQIVPEWGSSSDASDIREGLIALAATMGGGYMAAGGFGEAAAGAASGGAAAGGAAAGAAAGTTFGLTASQWAALQAAAASGAMTGAASNALGQLRANGWDIDEVDGKLVVKAGAQGGVTGALTTGINAYGADQGWNPAVTRAVSGGASTAVRGGDWRDIGTAAITGGANGLDITGNSALDKALVAGGSTLLRGGDARDALTSGVISGGTGLLNQSGSTGTNSSGGSNMAGDFNFADQFDSSNYDFGDTFNADSFSFDDYIKNIDWSDGGGFQNNGLDTGGTSTTSQDWLKKLLAGIVGTGGDGKGGLNLGSLIGGILGAKSSKDRTDTTSRAPWEPAQPYLKGLLSEGAGLYNQMQAQPFSQSQQTAYGNMGGLLDLINTNAGGLLNGFQNNANGTNQFERSNPQKRLVGSSFLPTQEQWQPGLLSNFGTKR